MEKRDILSHGRQVSLRLNWDGTNEMLDVNNFLATFYKMKSQISMT